MTHRRRIVPIPVDSRAVDCHSHPESLRESHSTLEDSTLEDSTLEDPTLEDPTLEDPTLEDAQSQADCMDKNALCAHLRRLEHSIRAAGAAAEFDTLMKRLDFTEHLVTLAQRRAAAAVCNDTAGKEQQLKAYQVLSGRSYVRVTNAWVRREGDTEGASHTMQPTCKACIKWYKRHGRFRAQKSGAPRGKRRKIACQDDDNDERVPVTCHRCDALDGRSGSIGFVS